jgi:hypothetical protein
MFRIYGLLSQAGEKSNIPTEVFFKSGFGRFLMLTSGVFFAYTGPIIAEPVMAPQYWEPYGIYIQSYASRHDKTTWPQKSAQEYCEALVPQTDFSPAIDISPGRSAIP